MFRVDDRSMIVSVPKRVRTGSSIAMSHPRSHKNPVKALRICHHAAHFAVVVEAVLWRNGTVRPTGVLDQFPAVSPEWTEVRIRRVHHRADRLSVGIKLAVEIKEWTGRLAK